jgi:uncharacterized protein (UPF0548 family)
MFFLTRPSPAVIDRVLRDSQDLPLSCSPIGIVRGEPAPHRLYQAEASIGHGAADFARARAALLDWKQFDIGWVETFPPRASLAVGTVVVVLIRHLGFWSLNGCRVVDTLDGRADPSRFGFAYGTLTNHAESGEELFEVFLDPRTDDVMYKIRASSWAQSALSLVGHPVVRLLQAKFRRESVAAMRRVMAERDVAPASTGSRENRNTLAR